MDTAMRVGHATPEVAPYDPAESPGPIPSVVERFRRRPYQGEEENHDEPQARLDRYTVILVTPEHAEALGYDRADTGLKLYVDDDWDCDVVDLFEAVRWIEDEYHRPVTLVEHTADLTYWTPHPRT